MKNIFLKKYLFSSIAVASVSLLLTACDKEESDENGNDNKTYTLSGSASGAQEVPAVTTSASGTLNGSYNSGTNTLSYNITWTGLSGVASAAHFHGPAEAGVSADVLVPITVTTPDINGSAIGSVVVTDSVESALLAGKVYYNVHTAANPTGEIRGQVLTNAN